jgi:large subunit ribosomal protein L28
LKNKVCTNKGFFIYRILLDLYSKIKGFFILSTQTGKNLSEITNKLIFNEGYTFLHIFSYIYYSNIKIKKVLRRDIMSRRCQVTGIGPISGNNVSHAHNRSRRRFLPNLQKKRIWVQELNRFVTLKLSAKAIKNISKNGTSEIAKMIRQKQIKVH